MFKPCNVFFTQVVDRASVILWWKY